MKIFGRNHQFQHVSLALHGQLHRPSHDPLGSHEDCASRFFAAFAEAFPAMQEFELDCYQSLSGGTSLGMNLKPLEPLFSCSELTELSLAGIQLVKAAELVQLLANFPKLSKLEVYGRRVLEQYSLYAREEGGELVAEYNLANDVNLAGLNLECLFIIRERLPHLKVLGISLNASPMAHLEHALWPFESLESLAFYGALSKTSIPTRLLDTSARSSGPAPASISTMMTPL